MGQGDRALPLRRQLGRPRAPSTRQLRRVRARRVEGEMARGARHRALDALLYRLWARASAAVFRPLPEGRGRLGQAVTRAAPGPAPRQVRPAPGKRMAYRAYAMDEDVSARRWSIEIRTKYRIESLVRRSRRWRHLCLGTV